MIEPRQDKSSILIVDDTPINLAVLCEILSESGFELLIAENGFSALKQLDHTHPDLILLDVFMPGMNGFETCRRLKENAESCDIPVIFMTALTETEAECKQLRGLNRYLEEELRSVQTGHELIGANDGLREVMNQVRQVAETDATVLVTGETGTGKELIAQAIHALTHLCGIAKKYSAETVGYDFQAV